MEFNRLFKDIITRTKKSDVCVCGLAQSVDSFFIYEVFCENREKLCAVLASDPKNAERICDELNAIEADCAKYFPQANGIPYNMRSVFGPTREQRMVVLNEILDGKAKIVVMPAATVFEQIIEPEKLFNSVLNLAVGEEIRTDILEEKLTNAGFSRENMITAPGQYSKRGGIFDIYAFGHENPVRLEFWGDVIDSIREFDIFKQRSVKAISKINILPMKEFSPTLQERDAVLAKIKKYCEENGPDKKHYDFIAHSWGVFNEIEGLEWFSHWFDFEKVSVFDYLPQNSVIIYGDAFDFEREFEREIQKYENHKTRVPEIVAPFVSAPKDLLLSAAKIKEKQVAKAQIRQVFLNKKQGDLPSFSFDFANQPSFGGDFSLFTNDLNHKYSMGFDVVIFAENEGYANRLKEMLGEANVNIPPIETLFITNGFFSLTQKIYAYCAGKIFDRAMHKKYAQKMAKRAAAVNFDALERGDIVVHIDHGIGKYLGVDKVKVGDFQQDCLLIEYQNKAYLRVPIIDYCKVQKYIGKDGFAPELSVLGSGAWQRKKERTREQLQEMAGKMIKLYAKREYGDGLVCGQDNNWQKEFEDSFEYEPTQDQITVIEQIKKDLQDKKPMDRLVCGDVGFGKTEVAMRAAFKAVMSGFQVAILAPTTVLAAQHEKTFRERMAEFPIKIRELSRLTEAKNDREIREKTANGEVDILIGTHKILSQSVKFKNLGLLVIDEEQRFGVKQKDLFKDYRASVNVLSMSATPIPRTLHLSMAGIRDLSLINTPPQNRLSIETKIAQSHDDLIKNALENELERGGQVFVVLNRIEGLEELRVRIENLAPAARIAVAHGQMDGEKIDKVMEKFVAGLYDVLVCTTIIENGIDIPNANTIIVEDADKLGLSQLYQLRGRVGRSAQQAFAYFLVKDFKRVKDDSMKRLKALEQYTDLGSGFQLAMRDLELRGAGNLLGVDQSGSISAVGFELYCQLLKEEIARLKSADGKEEASVETQIRLKLHGYFPSDYVADTSLQIMLYQKCTSAKTLAELGDFEAEITDRFGAYPEPVSELLLFMSIKVVAQSLSVSELFLQGGDLTLTLGGASEKQADVCSRFMAMENPKFTLDYGDTIKLKCKIEKSESSVSQGQAILRVLVASLMESVIR